VLFWAEVMLNDGVACTVSVRSLAVDGVLLPLWLAWAGVAVSVNVVPLFSGEVITSLKVIVQVLPALMVSDETLRVGALYDEPGAPQLKYWILLGVPIPVGMVLLSEVVAFVCPVFCVLMV
jgi:hypothetical protein